MSASTFGLLAAIQRLGNLAASGIARILWTALSPNVAFGSLAGWMALALVALGTSVRYPGDRHALALTARQLGKVRAEPQPGRYGSTHPRRPLT